MIDNITYEKIDGITLAFIPKKNYIQKQAMICFKYGSIHNNFTANSKNICLPPGVAHFLEHKMFEKEDYNVFDRFNKTGGNVNAYTNFLETAYFFTCVDNFYENFKELLNLVSLPYFTKENVEKEKGIIEQEIKMYDDDPYWRVYFNLMGIMYDKNNPLTNDIAGKVEDIKKIDEEMIYSCYNNFYTKDNCIIICCGDIDDRDKIKYLIENNLKINDKKTGNIVDYVDKNIKNNSYIENKMGIEQKIFNIGFKNLENNVKIFEKIICNKIILDLLFGKSSTFYEKLYQKGIIDDSFGFDFNNFGVSIFSGVSKEPKDIVNYIKDELDRALNKDIFSKNFDRVKNKHIGNFIKKFNVIDNIVSMEADYFSYGFNINEYYNYLKNVSVDSLQKYINFYDDIYLSVIN